MTIRSAVNKITEYDPLNFALTNKIPRRALTRFMGWLSKVEQPLVRDLSIAVWRLFCDVDLSDAKKTRFRSLHDAFIRELREGARQIASAPDVLVSPCDAIVGAHGTIAGNTLLQVKGSSYALEELLRDSRLAARYQNGSYATLRLTAGMYHRFHAPHDCRVERVTHIAGDVWNVNPATLARIDKVYCKNERAVLELELAEDGSQMALVAVAAVLVAGIRLTFADIASSHDSSIRPANARFRKGDELGWFEHGSTILVLVPPGYEICAGVARNAGIRMGEPLFRRSPIGG
jgi:phosphatidylserine decarboxylase